MWSRRLTDHLLYSTAMNGTAHEAETQLHGYIDFQAEFDVDADRRDRRMR